MKALNHISFPQMRSVARTTTERQHDDINQTRLNQNFKAITDAIYELDEAVSKIGVGGGALAVATDETLGGVIVGANLSITKSGILSVITAQDVEQDNTKPITSAAVYTEVGNINALLETI